MESKAQSLQARQSIERLGAFIPRVTPNFAEPKHLGPYLEKLEAFPNGNLRTVVATPPQHGKSETTIHAIVWWLIRFPHLRFIYITYGQERADRVEIRARNVARRAGLEFSKRKNHWTTSAEGGVIWTAFSGQIVGEPVDGGVIIDDPYKNNRDAESASNRAFLRDAMDGVVQTRMHRGSSAIVMSTRWVAHDLSGWLVREHDWEYINLKALADGCDQPHGDTREPGDALWSHRKTSGELIEIQRTRPYTFASQYQGQPRPREGTIFGEPTYYDTIPVERGYRVGYGLDLAYTAKTSSDWSVCIRLVQVGETYYVVGIDREQVRPRDFKKTVRGRQRQYRGKAYFYGAGTELGAADFFLQPDRDDKNPHIILAPIDLRVMNASVDKRVRATAAAEAWNSGRIQVPHLEPEPEWLRDLIEEISAFTGLNDPQDDQVDALAAVFDGMEATMVDFDESYTDDLPKFRA